MVSPLRRVLFVPDTHVPFEDKKAWRCMLSAARGFKPHDVVILGDLADCLEVSFHEKDPGRKTRLLDEIASTNARLDEIGALGANVHYCEGNHEFRLQRYIEAKAPALYGVMPGLGELLHIKKRGWTATPYKKTFRYGKLNITHDRKDCGTTAHIKARQKYGGNAVIGHTHHLGVDYMGTMAGECHIGAVFGWLGDRSKVDYTHEEDAARWMLGFGVGYREPSGVVHLQAVPIIKYRCVVEGKVYRA